MSFNVQSIYEAIKALGYSPNIDAGICAGISMMAKAAFFLNEQHLFDERLDKISKMDIEIFHQASKSLSLSIPFNALDPFVQECILFFEPLVVYQLNPLFSFLFLPQKKVLDLDKINWLLPERLIHQLYYFPVFSGIYNLVELEQYLFLLQQELNRQNIPQCSFELISANHAIHIAYTKDGNFWSFVDSNYLPTRHYTNLERLAYRIYKAFLNEKTNRGELSKEESFTVFYTKTTVRKEFMAQINKVFAELNQLDLWMKLHQVTFEKSRAIDSDNTSWMMICCLTNETHILKQLLTIYPESINLKNSDNHFALFFAIYAGNTHAVQCLFEYPQTDITMVLDSNSHHPLMFAINLGNEEITQLFLNHPQIAKVINLPSKTQDSPLQSALVCNNDTIFEMILTKSEIIDVNYKNISSRTVVHNLCLLGRLDLLKKLCKLPGINFEIKDMHDSTPFLLSCVDSQFDIAEWLYIHHHVNVYETLYWSVKHNLIDIIYFIINLPNIDLNYQDIHGDCVFLYACLANKLDLILRLLNKGVNPILKNKEGITGLDIVLDNKAYDNFKHLMFWFMGHNIWSDVKENLSLNSQLILKKMLERKRRNAIIEDLESPEAQEPRKHFKSLDSSHRMFRPRRNAVSLASSDVCEDDVFAPQK